jgi:quercetin dioxygenase-like cupin family protein
VSAAAQVRPGPAEPLWFLGTLVRIQLDGSQTDGRFSLFEIVLPRGAAPPLHSHPQDETFHVIEGEFTAWVGESPKWCGPGGVIFAPAGTPHTFRVESDTARVVGVSTPAGIEEYFKALGEPAQWPWLQPPADGPRVAPERIQGVEHELGIVRHGPPPPPA